MKFVSMNGIICMHLAELISVHEEGVIYCIFCLSYDCFFFFLIFNFFLANLFYI